MQPFTQAYAPQTYALMRMVAGFLFVCHGASKLFEFPMSPPEGIPPIVVYVAGPIELVGGSLVLVGLFGGWAAFPCSVLMALAYWIAHGTRALFPIQNSGELAALFCFVFLYISSQGSGIWSLDHMRKAPQT